MKKYFLKFWPIIFIFIIWFIFANPYFLQSKIPFPSTYQVNNFAPWSADSKFASPVKNSAMPDIITQIYPWKNLVIQAWKKGQIPLWNPYSFSGTPLLANYQSAALSPFNILFFIFPFVDAWSILVLLQPLLAGIFMYIFLRSLQRSELASLIASISFMFCGFITVWMGYATLPYAFLFLPLTLFCIEKYFQTRRSILLLVLSISVPLSFFNGHFQISLYFLIGVVSFIIFKFFSTKNISDALYLILSTVFGLLLAMPQILPSIELYLQSFRSLIFAKSEVIPWSYLSTFLAPDFLGNPVTRNDWFGHYAEWNAYLGVLPFMLATYSVISKKKSLTIFLFMFAIVVLSLAFPTPLQELFINLHIPVLSTSAASRIIVLFSFVFVTLSAFGFDQLYQDIKNKENKKIILWIASFALIFLIFWTIIIFKLFIPAERIIVAKSNLILPTIIFTVSAFIVFLAIFNKKILIITIYAFLLLVSFDMLRFTIKWMPFDPKNLVFPETVTTKAFPKMAGYERAFGNLGQEAAMYYKLPSVEGYDALYIKRYGELINFINGKPDNLNRSVVIFSKNGSYTPTALNLLNIKYIVHKLADDHAVWTFPFWTYPAGQFKLIYRDNMYEFYENSRALPHAFLVGNYEVEKDKNKILNLMFRNHFDLGKEVVLENDPKTPTTNEDLGSAKVTSYKSNYIEVSINAKDKALLFLSDNYYPGWKAFIDGKDAPILRADYTFRAVFVPKGKYTVKFSYDPWSFKLGVYLAIGGLAGIVFLTLISKNINHSKLSSS